MNIGDTKGTMKALGIEGKYVYMECSECGIKRWATFYRWDNSKYENCHCTEKSIKRLSPPDKPKERRDIRGHLQNYYLVIGQCAKWRTA